MASTSGPTRLKRARSMQRLRAQDAETALRAELFGAEQMERHGVALAGLHRLQRKPSADLLLGRLAENDVVLAHACETLTAATQANRRITPAGEWLLDNYYLIEEQIRIAQRHLPKGYSRELPCLAEGPSAGLPRVYDLALETIAHGDGRVDSDSLSRFVAAYQTAKPLALGELWAIPIMLRLALIENLRRVATRVVGDWHDRNLASEWADTMTEVAESDPKSVILAVADMARSGPPMSSSFVAELARRLQGQSPVLAMPLTWIEQRLAESGLSVEHLVQQEAQQQAADQVSIGNSIGSLRLLAAVDWRDFVERMSLVEDLLRQEPAGVYAAMDFATRDHYRHAIERLARGSGRAEPEVARAVLAQAVAHGQGAAAVLPQAHVGYHLVGEGVRALERQLGVRHRWGFRVQRAIQRAPLGFYLGAILLLSAALALPLLRSAWLDGLPHWALAVLALPALLLASQLAIGLVNWLAALLVAPEMLPRMDYQAGIPTSARTLVVVPSMFSRERDVEELVEGLEVRYLANRDENLLFALLTDFTDADAETLEQDAPLLRLAQQRVEALNSKYATGRADRFYLFHRPRRWNAADKLWMGYERKRGKLFELNALLRGHGRDRFALVVGDLTLLGSVRYVITLDTDTQLPRESAQQFISAMAHPLNQPVYDPRRRRVVSGYAILQPRVGVSLPSAARSAYARLFGSDAGIDPYTRMVSDVYQDLFGEGSFIGKGIYDVDVFERAVAERFPDNSVLSHDLVEGCYARSGLLSDVQLYEEYPASYGADVSRRHRWIRGDWQLLPWLLPWVPNRGGGHSRNTLSALSRWKIADNLRRSLVPASLLALLLFGWIRATPVLEWTLGLLAIVLTLPLLSSLLGLLHKSRDVLLRQHLRASWRSAAEYFAQAGLLLAWLPHEAAYSLDAILRTLWRVGASRRHLLQWRPSSEVARTSTNRLAGLYRLMWAGPALALLVALELASWRPEGLPIAAPFLLLWLLGPLLAWRVGRPRSDGAFSPSRSQLRFLRRLARRTWAFFETQVGADDHWLPPDNMQESPVAAVAHRTSPTNMGLALLANLAAFDFGFASLGRVLERSGHTLRTMQALPRYRRHFYNWYDTQSLQPLAPHYISTVDSGNLAGHLLTLRPGLLALADTPLFEPRQLDGLADTLGILRETLGGRHATPLEPLRQALAALRTTPPTSLPEAAQAVRRWRTQAEELAATLAPEAQSEAEFWLQALLRQCADLDGELAFALNLPASSIGMPSWRRLAQLDLEPWAAEQRAVLGEARQLAKLRLAELHALAQLAGELAVMDYGFLYDATRDLLSIGYNVGERRLDAGYYDLLASEARLTNFVAIAQGQLPQESWFTLGRLLTTTRGEPVLLSWSGSMFEYLMPMLVMPGYQGTLLEQSCRAAVARQIEYGSQLGIPWGVSESGYNAFDVHFNYQYRAFGVPGLGLKRGLGEDVVIAPYATVLALMVAPTEACANLQRLAGEGQRGRLGMYEAVDYTPARLPQGQNSVTVKSYMAHHQGMSLLSLAYLLLGQPMQRRFEADPQFRATMLLLQERVPKTAAEYLHASEFPGLKLASDGTDTPLRVFTETDLPRPSVQLLSNGRYHVMVTHTGGGYSRCRELAVTRWSEDTTRDHWGMFCYLRDVASGAYWSGAYQPTRRQPERYEAIFSEARAEFRVRERDFDAHTEIVVSPEDDIELRRVRVTNRGRIRRTIELTSYGEVVLAPAIADAMHPAFSKLFVQTEWLEPQQAILCTRRPRSRDEQVPWMYHQMAVHDVAADEVSWETDRARFVGRARDLAEPQAMQVERLSGSGGSVLDPVVAIRCRISLDPEQSATVDMVTGVGDSRDACLQLIGKYRDRHLADRVFDLAWTHSQVLLRQLNASPSDARLYERMAASIIYANASLRAPAAVLRANRRGQSGLWGQSISGDLPIVLLRIADPANIELVRQMVQAHAYWRLKGLAVDLVIWNEDHAGYRQHLQDLIMGLIASGTEASLIDRPGGLFVRPAQQLSSEDRILVQSVARVIVSDSRGSLAEQIEQRRIEKSKLPPALELSQSRRAEPAPLPTTAEPLLLEQALGGFSADGSEYVITLADGQATPAPWSNILANPDFGCVVSESGGSYTWAENAHEFRLSPWENDPVGDGSGEAFYLRDEESGHYWSPTPLPRRGDGAYRVRHGFGYSVFEHREDGIRSELWLYVALDAPVKFAVLKLRNESGRPRRLSATGYVEWVLGDLRAKSAMHVVSETDPGSGALFAHNAYNMEFPERVGFLDADLPQRGALSLTADRSEFIGRNGSLRAPAAMAQARLSGRVGAGLDPCAAIQLGVELAAGERQELVFRLGVGRDAKDAGRLAQRFRGATAAENALDAVRMHWRWTLGKVQVETPDPAVDVLANGWLMYQTIACRFWARSGYYQSGGAFGFRDQLQDSMAMIHATPYSARQHLLLCAAHQFPEGDVQHWWHPPLDRGVRTTCSDDYLWLPLATSRYVLATSDTGVLDETIAYVEGRPLNPGEESYYDLPARSERRDTLYQHCVRAIEHGLRRGERGLPLIGSGDWNDGMNRVGEHGRGESVWLGFFLYEVLRRFAVTARRHDDEAFAARCEAEAETLRENLERHAWDGAWYRRGWFDDGTPLGSAVNEECRIDSISQSWSVLSGAAGDARRQQAMDSLERHLVRRDAGLVQLLDPPFDRSALDPGYIKGYVPGVRENGGQYTHAAVWATMAYAALGDSERAWELLRMINPVNHARDAAQVEIYKVEPYVVAADVYAVPPHVGRGGWSWYTGSAGWMYRLIVESLLGLHVEGERLRLTPVLPRDWPGFTLHYRHRETDYHIEVRQVDEGPAQLLLNGVAQTDLSGIALVDDGGEHRVAIHLLRGFAGMLPPTSGHRHTAT